MFLFKLEIITLLHVFASVHTLNQFCSIQDILSRIKYGTVYTVYNDFHEHHIRFLMTLISPRKNDYGTFDDIVMKP